MALRSLGPGAGAGRVDGVAAHRQSAPHAILIAHMAQTRVLQKEATREHLFTVAMRLFEERGYPAVSVEEIVRAAEVARGTFYIHFPKKDDVLIELIRRSDQRIVGKIAAVKRGRSLRAFLRATADGFVEN